MTVKLIHCTYADSKQGQNQQGMDLPQKYWDPVSRKYDHELNPELDLGHPRSSVHPANRNQMYDGGSLLNPDQAPQQPFVSCPSHRA